MTGVGTEAVKWHPCFFRSIDQKEKSDTPWLILIHVNQMVILAGGYGPWKRLDGPARSQPPWECSSIGKKRFGRNGRIGLAVHAGTQPDQARNKERGRFREKRLYEEGVTG